MVPLDLEARHLTLDRLNAPEPTAKCGMAVFALFGLSCLPNADEMQAHKDTTPQRLIVLALGCVGLDACSRGGAPSFALFGAYFPTWMFCALIGIIGAILTRVVLTSRSLANLVPFQLAVCTASGVIIALLAWFTLFR